MQICLHSWESSLVVILYPERLASILAHGRLQIYISDTLGKTHISYTFCIGRGCTMQTDRHRRAPYAAFLRDSWQTFKHKLVFYVLAFSVLGMCLLWCGLIRASSLSTYTAIYSTIVTLVSNENQWQNGCFQSVIVIFPLQFPRSCFHWLKWCALRIFWGCWKH
jgi:hypothetical protein